MKLLCTTHSEYSISIASNLLELLFLTDGNRVPRRFANSVPPRARCPAHHMGVLGPAISHSFWDGRWTANISKNMKHLHVNMVDSNQTISNLHILEGFMLPYGQRMPKESQCHINSFLCDPCKKQHEAFVTSAEPELCLQLTQQDVVIAGCLGRMGSILGLDPSLVLCR